MPSSHRMRVSDNVGENRRCRRLPERRGERNAREETEEEGDATPPTCHVRPADKQIRNFDRNQPTRSGVTGMTGISTKVQLLRCLFSRRRIFLFFSLPVIPARPQTFSSLSPKLPPETTMKEHANEISSWLCPTARLRHSAFVFSYRLFSSVRLTRHSEVYGQKKRHDDV